MLICHWQIYAVQLAPWAATCYIGPNGRSWPDSAGKRSRNRFMMLQVLNIATQLNAQLPKMNLAIAQALNDWKPLESIPKARLGF